MILFEEVITPFYIFQVFSVVIWFLDNYASYASLIIFMSIISIAATIYETKRALKDLNRMSIYKTEVLLFSKSSKGPNG